MRCRAQPVQELAARDRLRRAHPDRTSSSSSSAPGATRAQDAPAPILRSDVLKMEDLAAGMRLKGTVRNVVDFGAFVDIGVKQDGLLHRTQIPPGTTLQVGDIIEVTILKVEAERGRISLGMEKE